MPSQREQMKSKIVAEIDVLVEQALAAGEKPVTLTQIEELVLG